MKTSTPVVLAVLAAVVLCGCTQKDPVVIPEPEPSSAPIFESDEEALAAAEVAYGEYLKVSNEITADGGEGAERIERLLSADRDQATLGNFDEYVSRRIHTTGSSSFDSMDLQQLIDSGDGEATVALYLCLDVSEVRILDSNGNDVTPARQERLPLEIQYEATPGPTLKLLASDLWTGDDFCAR